MPCHSGLKTEGQPQPCSTSGSLGCSLKPHAAWCEKPRSHRGPSACLLIVAEACGSTPNPNGTGVGNVLPALLGTSCGSRRSWVSYLRTLVPTSTPGMLVGARVNSQREVNKIFSAVLCTCHHYIPDIATTLLWLGLLL